MQAVEKRDHNRIEEYNQGLATCARALHIKIVEVKKSG